MSGAPSRSSSRALTTFAYGTLFVGACLVALFLIRPFSAGQIGFDSATSVLYFDRILAGRHLEAFVTTTPKPLLTVVYGIAYNLTGDWRLISWLAIAMFGLSAVMAAALVRRFGGLAGGVFAGIAVIGSDALLGDVAISYAVVWAFVGCLAAGLLVSSPRPRYGWAGVCLGLAALARAEVFLILGAALVVLIGAGLWSRLRGRPAPDPRAWRGLIGLVAVPLQLVHDWLLSGNPLYAEYVPNHARDLGLPVVSPANLAVGIRHLLTGQWPLVILAAIGFVILFRRQAWGVLVGLAAMGPGVIAFLLFLAWREIYITPRYFAPIDLTLIVAGAIGFGSLVAWLVTEVGRRAGRPIIRTWLVVAGSIAAAVALSLPFGPADASLRSALQSSLTTEQNETRAVAAVQAALELAPGSTATAGGVQGPRLYVPIFLRPQFLVDLNLPLTAAAGTTPALLSGDPAALIGRIFVHDRNSEVDPAFRMLEVSVPTRIGGIVITPLLADPAAGLWVDRIDPGS